MIKNCKFWNCSFFIFCILILTYYSLFIFNDMTRYLIVTGETTQANLASISPSTSTLNQYPYGIFNKHHYRPDLSDKSGSLPYVSGACFVLYSDFIYDEGVKNVESGLSKIKQGDVIFVKIDLIEEFFKKIYPLINARIIVITHNGDLPANFYPQLEESKLIAWFGQNPTFEHKKFIPIPIGLENPNREPQKIKICRNISEKSLIPWKNRKYLLYLNVNAGTNLGAREYLYSQFKNIKEVLIADKRLSFQEYMETIGNSKYVLCPKGNGLDTHRMYETVLMGAIPVVENSSLWPIYKQSTVLVVSNMRNLSLEMLKNPQNYINDMNFSRKILLWSTWAKLIDSFKV